MCDRFVYLEGIQFCVPLLDPAVGTAALALSAVPAAVGLYLVFVRKPTYRHTCAECGKVYRDRSLYSERRARGKMVCSAECAEKIEAQAQVEEMWDTVDALERLALQAPQGVQRTARGGGCGRSRMGPRSRRGRRRARRWSGSGMRRGPASWDVAGLPRNAKPLVNFLSVAKGEIEDSGYLGYLLLADGGSVR